MQSKSVVLSLLLVVVPVAGAQDPMKDVEHLMDDIGHNVNFLSNYIEAHADCDPTDLGQLQTDGYDADGKPMACDAPDSLEELDRGRFVAVNNETRGFLVFGHEGIDDYDYLTLSTDPGDEHFRYKLAFDLGLDNAPQLEFATIDFDVLTLEGESLLDYQSPVYDAPEGFGVPDFPEPRAGHEYHEIDVAAGYETSTSEYKVVVTPNADEAAPSAWVLLEDDSWLELNLQADNGSAKKYTAPVGDKACGVVQIVIELPDEGTKKAPHVAHAPAQGSCEGSIHDVPPPSKEPMDGEFTVPAWLAGTDLAVVIWVSEHTSEAGQRQGQGAVDTVLGLFAPRPASCDDEGFCMPGLGGGGGERADEPFEWSLALDKSQGQADE